MYYKTIYRAVLLFSIIAAVIAGVFMTVSLSHNSDIDGLNVYSSANVEYYGLVAWLFGICAVGYVVALVFIGKRFDKKTDFGTNGSRLAYGIMGCVSAALALFCIGREFFVGGGYYHGNMYVIFSEVREGNLVTKEVSWLYLAFLITLVCSAVFFFYAAFSDKKGNRMALRGDGFAALSTLPSVALALKTIYDFLLQSGNGYGALYNYHLLSIGFILLFSVNETRFHLKKASPSVYVFFGLVSGITTIIFSIPALALFLTGKAGANWHPAFCAVDMVIVVYIYYRLFTLKVHEVERKKKTAEYANAFGDEAIADDEGQEPLG